MSKKQSQISQFNKTQLFSNLIELNPRITFEAAKHIELIFNTLKWVKDGVDPTALDYKSAIQRCKQKPNKSHCDSLPRKSHFPCNTSSKQCQNSSYIHPATATHKSALQVEDCFLSNARV